MCTHKQKQLRAVDDALWGGFLFWHCPGCNVAIGEPITEKAVVETEEFPRMTGDEYADCLQATFVAVWGSAQERRSIEDLEEGIEEMELFYA